MGCDTGRSCLSVCPRIIACAVKCPHAKAETVVLDALECRTLVLGAFRQGIAAVDPVFAAEQAVCRWHDAGPVAVVAIGKAACGLYQGAQLALGTHLLQALIITAPAYQQRVSGPVKVVLGNHPVPDQSSLDAGQALVDFVQAVPADVRLLVLISGGASAMVELLKTGLDLADLQRVNQWLLASGFSIGQMNLVRKGLSRIKGGGLLNFLPHDQVAVMLVSDVPGDAPGDIGSGLLCDEPELGPRLAALPVPIWLRELMQLSAVSERIQPSMEIIASNALALAAIARHLSAMDLPVFQHAGMTGDALQQAQLIGHYLREAEPGFHLWGGETTVVLPAAAGEGGRNQHLALGIALEIADVAEPILVLAAATDGVDGNSTDAGALVDTQTLARAGEAGLDAQAALNGFSSNAFFAELGDLVHTGPTGTNVMDLVIACKLPKETHAH